MNLILGLVWISLGIVYFIEDDTIRWNAYVYLLAGIFFLGQYLWDITNQYLTVENGILKRNTVFGKKINLNDITWIKKFGGDYTLKTENQQLKINTELIEEKSLAELNKILGKLNLPSEKTPFANTV